MNSPSPKSSPVAPAINPATTPDKVSVRSAPKKELERRSLIIEGNIHRAVLMVAIPSVATMLLQTTNSLLDSFFVGQLGPDALAAVTISSSLMFTLMSAAMAISVGTTALVARFVGEGNTTDGVQAVRQSLILATIISIVLSPLMLLARGPLLQVLGLSGTAQNYASGYLFYVLLGLPSLFFMLILNGAFRGLGDTMRPFWISLAANIVHAIGNYLLIFGNLGFPKMGLPGGSLALVLSQVVATGMYVFALRNTELAGALRGRWTLDGEWIQRIARVGIPASLQQLMRTGSFLAFQSLLAHSPMQSAAVAALGVGLRSESIAFMPGFGYSIAASAIVGQNLGAKKSDRANAGAWSATLQAVVVMTLMGFVFALAAEPFARFFIKHVPGETAVQTEQVNQTIALTVAYLQIALWSEPFLALGMVLTGALQGAGETKGPSWITFATMVVLRLALGYIVLNFTPWGVIGAWWAMTISTMVSGVATGLLFLRGKWRTVEV